jgi:hypothetical protein
MDRQEDRQANRQTDTDNGSDGHAERQIQTYFKIDRHTYTKTNTQEDIEANRQT